MREARCFLIRVCYMINLLETKDINGLSLVLNGFYERVMDSSAVDVEREDLHGETILDEAWVNKHKGAAYTVDKYLEAWENARSLASWGSEDLSCLRGGITRR